ncbi:MAG: SAM-dependent methyltransferase [Bdellovibrionota bacterium]
MIQSAYWAHENFGEDLAAEIGAHRAYGRLLVSEKPVIDSVWAQNIWREPQILKIASIGDAVKQLKKLGHRWTLAPVESVRRSRLIEEQLRPLKIKPIAFLEKWPAKSGVFALLDNDTLIASPTVSMPFANGEMVFIESDEPPSRAYLKLWEHFTATGTQPLKDESCIDLGSCPGGWTWVLSELGCQVISVDKAPLDEKLLKRTNVRPMKKDVFTLKPEEIGKVDWLFSDVICEPRKLLDLVHVWRASGLVKHFVCTIKFKGATDHEVVKDFLKIEGSQARHLFNNKHEITWWV